jgi:hypothetical protein
VALDPRYFTENPYGPFPDKGQKVFVLRPDGTGVYGTVAVVWLCLDVVCIDVETRNGRVGVFPEFGDLWTEWKPEYGELYPEAVAVP